MTAAVSHLVPGPLGAALPGLAARAAAMLDQSMRRPSLVPLVLHSLHLAF